MSPSQALAGHADADTGSPGAGPLPRGQVSPWWILGAFVAAAAAGIGRPPAPATAAVLMLLFAASVARHPANGLVALVLASPFFLGEHKTPYFLLVHVGVIGVLLSFLAHRLGGRLAFAPAYAPATLGFVGAALLSLPLNLRDLREDLWLVRSLDWSLMLLRGIPDIAHLKYLERVMIIALGTALFTVASQPAVGGAVVRAMRPLAALVAALATFGLLRFFGLIRTAGQYLTLSFWTWEHPDLRLTAIAWNPDYLAQFLVLILPLMIVLARVEDAGWRRGAVTVAAGVGILALFFTFQRGAYAALLVALGTLGALLRWRARVRLGGIRLLVVAALVVGVAAGLDTFVLHGRVAERLGRFVDDPNRLRLWQAALRMIADHPVLGVGTGRYAFFFHEYTSPAERQALGPLWGSAHSLYLHLLAEQGLVGLAGFLGLFGVVWVGRLRRLGRLAEERLMWVIGLLAALAGWMAYGLVQYTLRVDALFYLVCVLAGVAVALAPPDGRTPLARRFRLVGLAIGVLALAVRADAALARPVSRGYEAGFHRWERQADGRPARWTHGRAAMTTAVGGRVLGLRFQAPIPGVEHRPQTVRVWVDGAASAVVHLAAPGWHVLEVPVRATPGHHVLVELEVGYTFVPSRLGASRDERRLGVLMGEVSWRDA